MEERRYKLPIITIAIDAIKSVWRLKESLLSKNGIPVIILIVLEIIDSKLPESSTGISILLGIATLVIYTLLVVNCHRIVLLNPSSVPGYGIRLFSKREWRFVGWVVSIYLLLIFFIAILTSSSAYLSFTVGTYVTYAIHGVIISVGFYIFSRLTPILPATAVDYDPDIYWAWDASKGNGWRLVIIICVIPFISASAISFIEDLNSNIIYIILKDVLSYIFVIFEVFALSLSFQYLNKYNSNKALNSDAAKDAAPVS